VVLAVEGKRLTLAVGPQARLRRHPAREITLICPLPVEAHPGDRLSARHWQLTPGLLAAAAPCRRELAAAWLLLSGSGQSLDWLDWAELVQGGSHPAQRAAAWLWLQGEQLWFCRHGNEIAARPLADLRQQRQRRRRQRLQLQLEQHWLLLLRQRQPIDRHQLSADQQQQLSLLLQLASGEEQEPLPASLQQALRQAHCSSDATAIRQLLVDLGQWDAHSLPSLRQSAWAQGFSQDLETLALELIASAEDTRPGDALRVDHTGLRCFTIDDDDTGDIDDAVGLEWRPDGVRRIWIHVADPGRLIQPGDPLDLEARRRGSSLYLAQGILPMFPWSLSSGPLSLRAGRRCPAWSYWVELDGEGAIAAYGICRSWVRPSYRLSYDDADELIDLAPAEEPELAALHQLLALRRRWRQHQGALLLDQSEGRIRRGPGGPELEITEPGPARLLVAEAMILAGAVVAEHGKRLGVALPYRSQLPSPLPSGSLLQTLPPGPVRHAALKQGLSRGLTTATPAPHHSLGLQAYVQATSPIRRYGDLLVQRQLALLQQEQPAIDAQDLQAVLADLEAPLRQGIQISRDDQRHWRQVWFEAHRHQQWQAQFLRWLRQSDQLGLVWIEALAMELPAHCPGGCEPAQPLLVKVHRVDPLQDCLQLRAHR
jgi:exoribonuclease II